MMGYTLYTNRDEFSPTPLVSFRNSELADHQIGR